MVEYQASFKDTGNIWKEAKMEAMSHNNAVRKCIEQSQQQSKRKSDDEKPSFKESFKVQETERNQKWLDTIKRIEDNPPPKLITAYKKLKEDIKKLSKWNERTSLFNDTTGHLTLLVVDVVSNYTKKNKQLVLKGKLRSIISIIQVHIK
jgi:hypothetical protein